MRSHFKSCLKGEGTQTLCNPCRGWYQIVPYALSEDPQAKDEWYAPEYPLVLLEINLCAYRCGVIGAIGLSRFERILRNVRESGCHAILRLMYDWDGRAAETEPESLEIILGHIEQISPLLKEYSAEIFISQGLLVGHWAEMHGSRFLLLEDMRKLFAAMADATDERTYLAVRTPAHWRICLRSEDALYLTPLSQRVGLYNDALCSSPSDLGTYADEDFHASSYIDKRPPKEERGFTAIISRRAPYGGETAKPYELNEGNAFLRAMDELCISYLNGSYSPQVLAAWKATPCKKKGPYFGKSCLDAIGAYMGYRLLAEDTRIKKNTLTVRIHNIGSAGLYRREPVTLALIASVGPEIVLKLDTDATQWGSQTTLRFPLPEDLPDGKYDVCLRIGSIALCNDGAFLPRFHGNWLGKLTIR